MRIFYVIFGVVFLLVAGSVFEDATISRMHFYGKISLGVALTLGGFILMVAAASKYRGHWAFIVGLILLCCATMLFSAGLENLQSAYPRSYGIALSVAAGLLTMGVLSLCSAHKLHQYAKSEEARTKTDGAAPGAAGATGTDPNPPSP